MSSVRLVSLGILVSRLLGLARDISMTAVFGGSTVLDAFLVAFRIPNLARQVLGEGALSTAFLPVFMRSRDEEGELAARQTLTLVTLALTVVLSTFILIAEVGLWLAMTYLPLSESTFVLFSLLARMLPYAVLICVTALFCATLHAQRQFFWPAVVPWFLNLIWLAGVFFVLRSNWSPVGQAQVLASIVSFAGVVQLAIPYLALQSQGLGFAGNIQRSWPRLLEVTGAILPVVIGMTILQASAILDSLIAWGFSKPDDGGTAWCELFGITPPLVAGTASAIYLGQRMLQFPMGVFGVALGTVLYPVLTRHALSKEFDLLRNDLSRGLRLVIAIGIPASAGLAILAWPVAIALFRHGKFSTADTLMTAQMIAVYSGSVWSLIGVAILNRAWYAIGERIVPMRLGCIAVVVNQLLNFLLIWPLGGMGLAWGNVISSAGLCIVTLVALDRRVGPLGWSGLVHTLLKSGACTLIMSAVMLVAITFFNEPVSTVQRILYLGIPGVLGAVTFLLAARAVGMREVEDVLTRS